MPSNKYNSIALNYVLSAEYYDGDVIDDPSAYWEQKLELGELDFIVNLISKIHSIGSKFLLFEDNKPIKLDFADPKERALTVDHSDNLLNDEFYFEEGNYRFDLRTREDLNFDENLSIDLDYIAYSDIESASMTLKRSDESEETIQLSKQALNEKMGDDISGYDLIIDSYKNKHAVRVVNFDDDYFASAFNEDGEWIDGEERHQLEIEFPHISSKYQGLLPLIKKFIRTDLLLDESIFNPTKLIKSIDIVPGSQTDLHIFVNVSNSKYQHIIDFGTEDEESSYINDFQNELNKVKKRLNKLLEDHCDLTCYLYLNCRTKQDQFSITAKKRLQEIVHQIDTLKNLTNAQYYQSRESDWQKIKNQLLESVFDLDIFVKLNEEKKRSNSK